MGLLFSAVLSSLTAGAQTIRTPESFTYTRLTAYSQQVTDAFSPDGNLGALPATKTFSAGIFSERRFGLPDLGAHAIAFVLPTTSGSFGLQADYLGSTVYNESSVGFAYGKNLGSKMSLGVQANYFSFRAAGYGAASTVTADLGVIVHLTPQLNAGVQACNPVRNSWGKDGAETVPAIYRAGLGYDVSKQVFVAVEAEKAERYPVSINAGVHYAVAEKLVARAGIRSATSVYYLGIGLQLKQFRFDVTTSVHPYLGLTPGLLLLYSLSQ
jgi:hypothetical protein